MIAPTFNAHAFRTFETGGWERAADNYDRFFRPITNRATGPVLDLLNVSTGMRLLDLATGPGYVAGQAAIRGASAVGIDIASSMVEIARARYPGIPFSVADAERLPFSAGEFDAVAGNFILPHLGCPEQAVAECCRVLGPHGRATFSMWDKPESNRLFGILTDALAEASAPAPAGIPEGPDFFRFSDDRALTGLLDQGGFTRPSIRRIRFLHRLSSPDELWIGLAKGTVRMSARIAGLEPSMQSRVRAAFDRIAASHAVPGGLDIPVSITLIVGRKRA